MSSTLSEGVRVPDIGSTSWGADVNFNWGLLNTALANISGNVKTDAENTWTAPQTFTETISGSIDGVAARAVGDEDGNNIKTALAGKQPSLSQSQLDACNSGITASAVQQIGTNASNISSLQTAVSGKAADNAVVHLAGAETITGDKTWTGSNAFNSILPNATNAYSLGSSSYQWASVYAQTYYYNGTAWGLDKANTWSKLQTISYTGSNIQFILKHTETDISSSPTRNNWFYLNFFDVNSVSVGGYNYSKRTNGNARLYLNLRTKNTNSDFIEKNIFFETNQEGTVWNLYPSSDADIGLGTSSNRWKTLNGINPGALSLPDISKKVNLDTTTWNLSGGNNAYTPSADGFLSIRSTTATQITIVENTTGYGTSVVSPTSATLIAFLPVTQGMSINIIVNCTSLNQAVFFPAKGNV